MDTNDLLRELAAKYENKEFLNGDPSWFMHQVSGSSNQELLGFIASCLSYGKRDQFFPKIQKILDYSNGEVEKWIRTSDYKADIADNKKCYYRLYSNHTMFQLFEALKCLIDEYGTIGEFVKRESSDGFSAIVAITKYFNSKEIRNIIPQDAKSACKRVCMFLRWMVRDNSPVDLGLWQFIDKRTLIMPLDTHVLQEAYNLKLLKSHTASMSAAQKLTHKMSEVFPDDPLKGDFTLFGYGINK